MKAQQADSEKAATDAVGAFVDHGADGQPITSIDSLKADPEVWDKYNKLPEQKRHAFETRIAENAKHESNEWTPEKEAHFNELKGKVNTLTSYEIDSDKNLMPAQRKELHRLIQDKAGKVYINRVLNGPDIKNMLMAAGIAAPSGSSHGKGRVGRRAA